MDEIDETEIVANSILKQHNTFDKYDEENHSQLEVDHGFTEEQKAEFKRQNMI